MKERWIFVLFVLVSLCVQGQTIIEGSVKNEKGNYLEGAIVSITSDTNNSVIGYKIANNKGYYRLQISSNASNLKVAVSLLGYQTKQTIVSNKSQNLNIILQSKEIQIKEVIVKSNALKQRGDTLAYSVSSFKSRGDRTIGDILKKIPGIEVSKSGAIKYNGEAINKFYIEGMDLLDSKYGIATNNVPVDAVTNVEVIENNQPIKALKNFIETGKAAINLKLKNGNMKVPVGTIRLGSGGPESFLWNFDAFALQANRKRQTIAMYKTCNTGEDIAAELTEQSINISDMENADLKSQKGIFNAETFNTPPLEKERYLFNKAHVLTLNSLWKTSKDKQFRFNTNYVRDVRDETTQKTSSYFLPNDTLVLNELNKQKLTRSYADALLTYTNNSAANYLNNSFKIKAIWNDLNSSIEGTNRVIQNYDLPEYTLQNNFRFVKKMGKRIFDISSLIRYSSLPQTFIAQRDTINLEQSQDVRIGNFFTDTRSYISFTKGYSTLKFKFGLETTMQNINSSLADKTPIIKEQNDLQSSNIEFTVNPIYNYQRQKWSAQINVPFVQHLLSVKSVIKNTSNNYSTLYINPSFNINYRIHPFWRVNGSYSYSQNMGDIMDFLDSNILTNYRTMRVTSGILSKSQKSSSSISLNYRNPLSALFFNTSISYFSLTKNLMSNQKFVGNQAIISTKEQNSTNRSWMWQGYGGKYVADIKTTFSLSANYSLNKMNLQQQGVIYPVSMIITSINPVISSKVTEYLFADYQAQLSNNKQKIGLAQQDTESSLNQISQKLKCSYYPTKNLGFNVQLEHLYNEITKSTFSSLAFANLGISYKFKQLECTLNYNNIFNQKEYSYVSYSGLDTYRYSYKLRPAEIVMNISFRY